MGLSLKNIVGKIRGFQGGTRDKGKAGSEGKRMQMNYTLAMIMAALLGMVVLLNLKASAYQREIESLESRIKSTSAEIQKLDKKINQYRKVPIKIEKVNKEAVLDSIGHFGIVRLSNKSDVIQGTSSGIVFATILPSSGDSVTSQEITSVLKWFQKKFGETQVALVSVFPVVIAISVN